MKVHTQTKILHLRRGCHRYQYFRHQNAKCSPGVSRSGLLWQFKHEHNSVEGNSAFR